MLRLELGFRLLALGPGVTAATVTGRHRIGHRINRAYISTIRGLHRDIAPNEAASHGKHNGE